MNASSLARLLLFVIAVTVFDSIVRNQHLITPVSGQSTSSPPRSVEFKPTFEIIDKNVAPVFPNGNAIARVLYDAQEQMAYYVLGATRPDAVCRYSLKIQSFTPNYCIPMGDGDYADSYGDGFIREGVAFFPGSRRVKGSDEALVCSYNVSLSNFSLIKCHYPPRDIASGRVTSFSAAVIDVDTDIAYFGGRIPGSNSRRTVCAMNLTAAALIDGSDDSSFISCNSTGQIVYYKSAVIDENRAYFASSDSSVCQYSLISPTSGLGLTFDQCVEVNLTASISFDIAIVDSDHHYGYFAGTTQLSSSENFFNICKFQLGYSVFDFINCLTHAIPPYARLPSGLQSQTSSQIVFFPLSGPFQRTLVSFNLSSSNFSFNSVSPLVSIAFQTAFVDPASQRLYLSSTSTPTRVCHIKVSDFSQSSSSSPPVNCTEPEPVPNSLDQAKSFVTGTYDPVTQTALFASRSAVCKYDTHGEDLDLVGCISNSIHAGFGASVFNINTGMAIFVGNNLICSVNQSFLFEECVQRPQFTPTSAVLDSNRSLMIFSGMKIVCVYFTSPLSQLHSHEEVSLNANILSSVYDSKRSMLYVGLSSKSVCRFQISASAPFVEMFNASTDCIFIGEPNSQPGVYVAMIDETNDLAYFSLSNALLCQVNISVPTSFALVHCAFSSLGLARAGFMDSRNDNAYLCGYSNVWKYRTVPGDFRYLSDIISMDNLPVVMSLFDPERNMAFLATELNPARIYRLSLNTFSCSDSNNNGNAAAVANNQTQLQQGQLWITELKNCDLTFANVTIYGGITFVNNPTQAAAISLHNVTFDSPSSSLSLLSFSQSVNDTRVSLSSIKNEQVGSSLVHFSPSSRISSSDVLFFNDTLTQGTFVSFTSSSSLDSTTSFTFESNTIVSFSSPSSASIASFESSTPFNLKYSKWNFTCTNNWLNGYFNQFKELMTFNNDNVSGCDKKTGSASLTASPTTSRTGSRTDSSTYSLSTSKSSSPSTSTSFTTSVSESVFCFNLNQQQCSDVGPGNCHFCSTRNLCVPREQDCNCAPLDENLCPLAAGCHYCSNANVCVEDDLDCECYVFGETACKIATSTCRWCPNFNSCLPQQEECYCSTLGETACTRLTQNKCTYCSQQEICLPTTDFNKDTCSCLNMNSSNCQASKCSWCDNYQTCGLPDWDCDCTSLSNSSSSCAVNSNNHCKLCQEEDVCVDSKNFTCRCENFTEAVCDSSSCKWCDTLNSCTLPKNKECNCYLLRGQQSCDHNSNGKCHFCSNFNSCLPLHEKCYCSTLSQYACTSESDGKCTYCPDQEICLPTADFNKDTCSCLNMNSSNCQTSNCSWCTNYQTCGLPDWDCDCTSLSNTSASACSVNSNDHCQFCHDESVCVDAKKFTCRCENFTQSVCGSTSSCKWCSDLNSCTLPENKNCTCNWLRFEDSCNRNSNNKCSWCATSSDTGTAKHNSIIPNFDYCINNDGKDQCQCSYLSPSVCAAANDPTLNKNLSLSTSCRYCPSAGICAHPGNDQCECGNFEQHACATTSLCTWKDPVLTADEATQYCSAASVMCSPVMCEGILTQSSCDASGCSWNFGTSRCGSNSVCFNFFVSGFTPQPMLLWVIGLLKDVLVVFLVGAYANTFTRPIMKFVTAVKKKVLKQTHIRQQMMEETVYMCDKHCRDDLSISFPQYVERVCESVFELENDDLLDEKNRRVLFDAVAYTLFDNMIWVDIDLLQKKDNDEDINFNKKFGLENKENSDVSQHELKDLTVEKVDVKDDDHHEDSDHVHSNAADSSNEEDGDYSVQEFLEGLTASLITKISGKHSSRLKKGDVNTRGQIFGRFIAAATTQYDTYLKTKNVDVLKIKVFLTAQEFDSSVTLTKKVDESLIERASAYVFYDQSRSRKVCAAASANTFPPALSLIYYSVALLFLFVSSMITVRFFGNFGRMVQSCDEFIPLVSNNASFGSNMTSTTSDPRSDENVIDGSYITGAYFLLGFRLLNSSAFSTAILVFVKVVRGLYQRFSGIYTLSLQQRIPLMALYSDRFTHVMLFLYALLVLPFALCGPTYGSSFGIHCWVPIFIAAAILIGDALVLYVTRQFSSLKNRLLTDKTTNEEKQQALSKKFGDLNENFEDFLDSSPSKMNLGAEKSVAVPCAAPAAKSEVEQSENLDESLLSYTPREGDGNANDAMKSEEGTESKEIEQDDQLDEDVVKQQSSIESTSPVNLWNALLVFIMTEEIPVVVISLALQLSFNYAALLHYGDAFGLRDDHGLVYKRDSDSRSMSCIVSMFENDVSSFLSGLSSFVPFM